VQTNWPSLEGLSRHPALETLAVGHPDAETVDAFLAGRDFPLAEPGMLTFAWRGPADHVHLVRWIHGGGNRLPFVPLAGTDLWLLRLPVEDGGRFEYKLAVGRDGHEELTVDQLNPARAGDPFGENSVARTLGYNRPEWSLPRGAPAGRIEVIQVASRAFGEARDVGVYLPAGHDPSRAYPLVVIHDGDDFVAYADLPVVLDNLIEAEEIPPVITALVQTRDRLGEYSGGRQHPAFLVGDLLPALAARWRISETPGERVLLGASLGAVASLVTAFRHPGVFGGLVLKSGSFILDERKLARRPHPVFHRIAR
jgi:enterochelin esterase family protein